MTTTTPGGSRRETLAASVLTSRDLLKRYLAGFDDSNRTRQGPDLPNHIAWSLGHCALTMDRVREKLGGDGPPRSEFVKGDGRGRGPDGQFVGPSGRFDTESVCFGSVPPSEPDAFPAMSRCIAVFDAAAQRLADHARRLDESSLDALIPWGSAQITGADALTRMVFHNGTHCGQIADLRRALKMKSVFA